MCSIGISKTKIIILSVYRQVSSVHFICMGYVIMFSNQMLLKVVQAKLNSSQCCSAAFGQSCAFGVLYRVLQG